jgi:hypothetical protein
VTKKSKKDPEDKKFHVTFYTPKTKKTHTQVIRISKLIGKKVVFTTKEGTKEIGLIISTADGILVEHKNGKLPAQGSELFIVNE